MEPIANYSNVSELDTSSPFYCGVPPSLPPDVPEVVNTIQAIIALMTILLSLLLNSSLLFLVIKFKLLHERQFYLSLQLSISHLVFSTTVLVTVFVSGLLGEWVFGDVICQLVGPLHDMWVAQRFFLTLVLTLDRAFTIFMPFRYGPHSRKMTIIMSLVAWFFAINRVSVVMKFGLNCYTYVPTFKTCTSVSCNDACQGFILAYAAFFILSGAVVPFAIYIIFFSKAKKASRSIRRMSLTPLGGLEDRRKVERSNAERDRRAMITMLILFCALVGCTIPPYTIYTVQFALPKDQGPYPTLLIFQMLVGRTCLNLLTVIDPIVLMRNRDIRETIGLLKRKYFKCMRSVEGEKNLRTMSTQMNGYSSGVEVSQKDTSDSIDDQIDPHQFTENSSGCKPIDYTPL